MNKLILSLVILSFVSLALSKNVRIDPSIEQHLEPMTQNFYDQINLVQDTWVAGKNKRFEGHSIEDFKRLLGARKDDQKLPVGEHLKDGLSLEAIPNSFDSREQWPNCESIKEVRDQSDCGSCWAFGAVEALSDRICIASGQTKQTRVSSNDLTACCTSCGNGCEGGQLGATWQYFKNTGVVTGDLYRDNKWCQPYTLKPCDHHVTGQYKPCTDYNFTTPACTQECNSEYSGSYSSDKQTTKSAYSVGSYFGDNESAIQKEIMQYGPVECAFDVYADFESYTGGIYQKTSSNYLGGHAIKILGWGIEGTTKYWLVANSWNEDWGEKGFFRILRGSDECGIEDSCTAGQV